MALLLVGLALFATGGMATPLIRSALAARPVTFPRGTAWMAYDHGRIAPFKIVTPPGASYYVKLVEADTKQDYAHFHVEGGKDFETKIAPGRYVVRYASGTEWYGLPSLFGSSTKLREGLSTLTFTPDRAGSHANIVTLTQTTLRNLPTRNLTERQF